MNLIFKILFIIALLLIIIWSVYYSKASKRTKHIYEIISIVIALFSLLYTIFQDSNSINPDDSISSDKQTNDEQLKTDSVALRNYGYLYASGNGVEQNLEKAKSYYQTAIELNDNKAKLALLGAYLHNDLNEALRYIESNMEDEIIKDFLRSNLFNISLEEYTEYSREQQKAYILENWYTYKYVSLETGETVPKNTEFIKYNALGYTYGYSPNGDELSGIYTYDIYQYECLIDDQLYFKMM